ncbi:glycosyltransferase family 2 protein [Microcoleus sp. FACHB-68]|uniref:glycosyltransferase family 2 protein n=1 Tax=Microcoleus sp. FACHB-68 TaxID=2692826 RepID=UPI001683B43E|nr:glycosyltransferase family 2 protein [Microcoleus sp. FACHB-68]MBD1939479.1 glycosyltransferase family 2 protein [Microcoleus sp. FACHB-68]
MVQPVDLLLITWNRREYVEKTLPTIFNDPSDFRLYCWDNGSQDGTADLIASINDPRVVKRQFNSENVGQYKPCMWFFETAASDVLGKVDDDILLPAGWVDRIAPMLRKEPKFGMLGCWIFMPEDWNEKLAQHNIVELSGERVFRCTTVAGQSFLARKEHLLRYSIADEQSYSHGLPINRVQMTLDGLISGNPLPMLYAHNMDDPRSPMNVKTKSGNLGSDAALTARKLKFESAEDYAKWIAADARRRQELPFNTQIEWELLRRDNSFMGKIKRKLLKTFVIK